MREWTQKEIQSLIGRGKFVIQKVADNFNQQNYPTAAQVSFGPDEPVPTHYAANYALRIKKSDRILAQELWVNHVYTTADPAKNQKYRLPHLFRNKARTSRYAIKEVGGERNRHLSRKMGKLVAAGILLGEKIKEGHPDEREYGNQYTNPAAKGNGYGYKPTTATFSTGFYYYWSPAFIELMRAHIPEFVSVEAWNEETIGSDKPNPLHFSKTQKNRPLAPLATNSSTYVKSSQIKRNEVMSEKASSDEERSQEDIEKGRKSHPFADGKSRGKKKGDSGPAANFLTGNDLAEDVKTGSIARRMATEGKMVIASAVLLVQMYLRKIAPLTGKAYHPRCVETALNEAISLMSQYAEKDQDQAFNAYSATIERVSQRLSRQDGFFVVTPDKWFSKDYGANIEMHHRNYVIPWHNRKSEFDDWKMMTDAAKAQKEGNGDDWARNSSIYSGLAYALKTHLVKYHPQDYRLKNADLARWTAQIRAMIRNDKVPYDRAVSVAKWMLTSKSGSANWWRKEACFSNGIKSPTSFRKHFGKIEAAFIQATNTDQKFTA